MTSPQFSTARVPGPAAGHSALDRLIATSRERFADQVWGRDALLSTATQLGGDFDDLLSADAVDELVSERGLRTPFLRVAQNGDTLGDRLFTAPGGVGAGVADQVSDDKLVRLFADGATIVLQGLHRMWPPTVAFCQQLAADLGHPVQANAYVTPPQNQGFGDHYDVHDVFVLQISGEKRWRIHPPVLDGPLRNQPWTDRKAAVQRAAAQPPSIETVLRPGDCLYLPRGYLHAATALGGVSTHLTIGVHSWTRYALAEQLLDEALQTLSRDPAARSSLPLGVDFSDASSVRTEIEAARQALSAALADADPERVATAMQTKARGTQRAAPIGPLRQLRDADAMHAGSTLVLRRFAEPTLVKAERSTVRSRVGDFPVSDDELDRVATLLDVGEAPAGELGLELSRRLLRSGLATLR